jgi:methylated-DNA-[protein]-cysteine S-methyltransferase
MLRQTYFSEMSSPIGDLLLASAGEGLTEIRVGRPVPGDGWKRDDVLLAQAREQLLAYFGGELFDFDLPLDTAGTPFQRRVWDELGRLNYGETLSYGDLARRIGQPKAARAVGSANGSNPVPIIVPCHRVIGANGGLGGYGLGLDRKRWLLGHETKSLAGRAVASAAR